MNQFFNSKRFSLLLSKHWADNKNRYSLSVLAFMGMLIIWFLFTILTEVDVLMAIEIQEASYWVLLFGVGAFYASQYFQELGSRITGSNFLLVPASTFEKLLCGILYNVVLFVVAFTAAFYLVDILMVTICNSFSVGGADGRRAEVVGLSELLSMQFVEGSAVYFLCIFLSVQASFLLGSVYFEKYGFVKTMISGFVACFIIFFLLYFFYADFLPEGDYTKVFPISYHVFADGINDPLVTLPGWLDQLSKLLVLYGIAPFLWIVIYYRLKEKQV